MTYTTDRRVDAYIDALPDWQQAICREVRDLVHAADPEVTETIKYTDRPYFVLEGNICALLAAKDHVNVFLYDGAIVPDPEGIITGGHENQTARTVAVREGETINAPALKAMFKQMIANNRAGGWRKLKREADSAASVPMVDAEGGAWHEHRDDEQRLGMTESEVSPRPCATIRAARLALMARLRHRPRSMRLQGVSEPQPFHEPFPVLEGLTLPPLEAPVPT